MALNRLRLFSLLLALLLALLPDSASATLRCEMLPNFFRSYLQNHVRFRELTPEIEQRTIDTYLRRLDPGRNLLTAPEAGKVVQGLEGLFDQVLSGECSGLTELHRDFVVANQAVVDLVTEVLESNDYAIDSTVELVIDPDERGYPENEEERRKLLMSLIHFQISNYLSSDSSLKEARERLIRRYVRRQDRLEDLDTEAIYASFLDAFALSLDPHSNYLSAETWEDFKIQMTLSLEGIGVALSERDGYAVAEHIIPGGAADRQKGLQPKDKIIAVAQEGGAPVDIIDMPLREAVSLIRGERGTKVILTVLRQGQKTERLTVAIVRDKINLEEQAASLRFEDVAVGENKLKIAVLELPSFYGDADPDERQSSKDVAKLLQQVNEEGADGLVLDLSRNGGGLLDQAVIISGYFLRRGEIVRVETGRGQKQPYVDRDDRILYDGPMVVHTSRMSASASEILAGALKDYGRAVIAGDDHTFGKGTVQSVQALPPGQGAFKITTAMFFRPGGKSTQRNGVAADVVIPSLFSNDDLGEKTQRFSLPTQEVAPFLSKTANASRAENRWNRVTQDQIRTLVARSKVRIEKAEAFETIRKKLAEQRANGGIVRLADILKDQNDSKVEEKAKAKDVEDATGETESKEAHAADEMLSTDDVVDKEPTPELVEAIKVLTDLVEIRRQARVASHTL